ncbi:hypothetical protein SERLA73DRAFT_126558 [Serpula lacrymans var. lacrymans S7.3]|uniref:Uncharacterized protein n=2 Tax=Serpula lacrymans var. lacrymans TaxID=341189 RepID=F8QDN8_SERL3|nr:uncharacterized protein SERLADRAFT_403319 [Serpula lacrymans var. lacrymans S7.9]EGN93709.1 hypothetical protein SERLA73DRAFT_126558 [Serpula lacrymans var. lacrymans S7.3]EGO19079.1 hypothetical protein SERLADRAFT_403319 [Serpula lacrymans var. lacrymans S7.9]
MSAAAVERAFNMWAERKINWDPPAAQSQAGSAARKVKPIRDLNKATGKNISSSATFSDANWGKATRSYVKSIKALKPATMDDIATKASIYVPGKEHAQQSVTSVDGNDDPRACLLDV